MNHSFSSGRRDAFHRVAEFERVGEARAALADNPGLLALVRRGRLRNAVMCCPCGCGDILTVNLDPEAGKSWRVKVQSDVLTLMPSVWRDSGCESHFVLWENRVWWCGQGETALETTSWPEVVRVTVRAWWRSARKKTRRQK